MELKTYLRPMSAAERDKFARRCGTTIGHMTNVAGHHKPCSPKLAAAIEVQSGGEVSRQEMRDDWREIWLELRPIKRSAKANT